MDWLESNSVILMLGLPALGGIVSILTKNTATAAWFGCMYIGHMILYVGLRLLGK